MSKRNKERRRKQQERRQALIALRYWLPLIWAVLVPLSFCIPCLQYTTNQTGTEEPISGFELMSNAWSYARECLFGGTQQTNGDLQFSGWVVGLLIAFWALYLVGVAAAVWGLWASYRYVGEDTDREVGRLWFITVIPNRVVLCLLCGLMLPISAFPWLMVPLYRIIYVAVTLELLFVGPLSVGLLFCGGMIALSAVCAPYERRLCMDAFRKTDEEEDEEEAEDEIDENAEETAEEDLYLAAVKREQAIRIAKLLRGCEPDEKEDKE